MTHLELSHPAAVLFDWDNTLVNNWPVSFYAVNRMLDHFKLPAISMDELKNRPSKSAREALPELFGDRWQEASDFYYKAYRDVHLDMLEPLPFAHELLVHLSEKKIPMGVVSNKNGDSLRIEISHLGWNKYFQSIIGSYDTPHDKPSPVPVEHALKAFPLEMGPHIWFVGDNEVDMITARHGQLTGIFINDFEHIDKLKESHPGVIHFQNLMNFIEYLKKEG